MRFCVVLPTLLVKHLVSVVFLDENNSVKLGDFGLSKVLTQASLANTYVGVCSSSFSLLGFALTSRRTDTILHVPRANAREGVRLEIGYLVVGMPHL